MSRELYILVHAEARRRAVQSVQNAPEGHVVTISEPAKSREQENLYHALVTEIAPHLTFLGRKWSTESAKRLLVDAFAKAMRDAGTPLHHDGEVVPSFDGQRIVQLGIQTRDFYKAEASAFVEFLNAYAVEIGVWSDEMQA